MENNPQQAYSVNQEMKLLNVSRWTVYKWLSIKNPRDAVIPENDWFRLPGGHIRIKNSAIRKLQKE